MPDKHSSQKRSGEISNQENSNTNKKIEYWGHKMRAKNGNTLRICFHNTNGLPLTNNHHKNEAIFNFLSKHKIDTFGISEVNICWKYIPIEERWADRTLTWFQKSRTSFAYLDRDKLAERFQRGGVGLMNIGHITRRFTQKGWDNRKLGRWVWSRFRGKKNSHVRIISIYCPTKNDREGSTSVYSQQRRILLDENIDECPIKLFYKDLWEELEEWVNSGDRIIIGGDFNIDTEKDSLNKKFADLGMINLMSSKHPNTTQPNTFKEGTKTIDAVFVSSDLRINRCGMLDFDEGIPSDHRPLWLDIPLETLFDNRQSSNPISNPRRLNLQDPRSVQKYTTTLQKHMRKHKIKEKVCALRNSVTVPMSQDNIAQFEKLDKIRLEGIKHAEKKCRKLKLGKTPWSPELSKARKNIVLWNMLLRQQKNLKINTKKLIRLGKQLKITVDDTGNIDSIKKKRKEAYQKWNELTRNAESLRTKWLEELAENLESKGKGNRAKILETLIFRERQRRCYKRLKRILSTNTSTGVTTVKITTASGDTVECTEKDAIESACLKENHRRFTQANQTTFASEEIARQLDRLGVNSTADDILKGVDTNLPISEDQTKFMKCLKTPNKVKDNPIPEYITPQQWRECWKNQKEDTSAGPSGLHFGHMKANARNEDMCYIDATLAAIPFATGYSPRRWQKGTNVMLYKKVANNHVEKLRTILLYEADFNAVNKILGRKMLANGEKCDSIAPEQYGSRKNKTAIIQCLNKKLTFDLWRQRKTPGALLSNDAKSCYDRILHNIASISMQRQGVGKNNITCMFTTIQKLTHTVRTAFGDSESSFTQDLWATPLHGVGQGNGAGPAIWAVVSTPILDLLRNQGIGAAFKMCLTKKLIKIVGYSFVDDTDLVVGGDDDKLDDIYEQMQQAVDLWQLGIESTGGALVPEKSFWSEVAFQWDNKGQWSYVEDNGMDSKVYMKDKDNINRELRKTRPSEAIETLGVHLAPDGNDTTQYEVLRTKAIGWANKIKRGGNIARNDAWICMNATICKTLEYPLPVTCLTRAQCTSIMAPVLDTALPGVGISRKFNRKYIHGPPECYGLSITSLYVYQGASHVDMLTSHWKEKSTTGELLRGTIECLKVELGLPSNPLQYEYERWSESITPCWITATWKFMSEYDISIDLEIPEIPLRREKDQYLMKMFYDSGATKIQLRDLNKCRLHLKVVTLADIFEANGKTITTQAWNGDKMMETRKNIIWPDQPRPIGTQWTLWRSFLRKALLLNNKIAPETHALGKWTEAPEAEDWKWFIDIRSNHLFKKQGPFIEIFNPRSRVFHNHTYIKHSLINVLPISAIRCTVSQIHRNKVRLHSYGDFRPGIIAQTEGESFPMEIEENQVALADIIEGLKSGTTIAVSDGSFKLMFGTAAFILYNTITGRKIRGCIISSGGPEDQSPYRSELIGLAGIITHVATLCDEHNIPNPSIEIACDGLSALENISQGIKAKSKTKQKHYDIIAYAKEMMSKSKVKWTFRHVYGHRDDITSELTIWEQLNVMADSLAKEYWDLNKFVYEPNIPFKMGFPTVCIGSEKVCSKLRYNIQTKATFKDWEKWWIVKQSELQKQHHNVDWYNMRLAFKSIHPHEKIWVTKHSQGTCGVNKWLHRWKQSNTPKCPRCNRMTETSVHVWKCEDSDNWNVVLDKWERWLRRYNCPANDITAILNVWTEWRTDSPITFDHNISEAIRETLEDQLRIGWDRFAFGYVSKRWDQTISQWPNGTYNPSVSSLIKLIWTTGRMMWEERNEFVHNNEETKQGEMLEQINRMIEKEYESRGIGLPEKEQCMFAKPVKSIIKASRNYKRNWLGRLYAARAHVRRRIGILTGEEVEDRYKNERALIHTWRGSKQKRKKPEKCQKEKVRKKRKLRASALDEDTE